MTDKTIAYTPADVSALIDDIVTSCCNSFGIFLMSDVVEMIMSLHNACDYYNNDRPIVLLFTKSDAEDYIRSKYDSYENFNDSIREKRIEKVSYNG